MRKVFLKDGFTLIELSLSIAFIGILSITIALIINSAISSYRRGLTLNQVNTIGMDVADDMRAALQNSPVRSPVEKCDSYYSYGGDEYNKCVESEGIGFVSLAWKGSVNGVERDVPLYGVFCTGTYSYVWNSGYLFNESSANGRAKLAIKVGNDSYEGFRLLKVRDDSRSLCVSGGELNNNSVPIITVANDAVSYATNDMPYDLLAGNEESDNDLVLYDLSATAPAKSSAGDSLFYSVSFILGTVRGGININASGDFCAPPNDYEGDFDYCAINKFNFAAQATGG